jgi:hypothetical protein
MRSMILVVVVLFLCGCVELYHDCVCEPLIVEKIVYKQCEGDGCKYYIQCLNSVQSEYARELKEAHSPWYPYCVFGGKYNGCYRTVQDCERILQEPTTTINCSPAECQRIDVEYPELWERYFRTRSLNSTELLHYTINEKDDEAKK